MLVLNYLVLILIGVSCVAFLLIDAYVFYTGITIIIEDIKKEKGREDRNLFYLFISTLLKIASEIVVLIIGYVILCGIIEVINIMMKGGHIQW